MTLILSRAQVQAALDLDQMITRLEDAFVRYSSGRASVPPRTAAVAPTGLLGSMPGYLEGTALAAKIVSVFPGNHDSGVPSHQGLIVLFDETNGAPLAVMDAVYITAMRTAGGSAVSIKHLSRSDARTLAVLGAGAQGDAHLTVVPLVKDFEEIRVASRDIGHARALAEKNPIARAAETFEEAVRGADVICCCTDTRKPILEYGWLQPGAHVASVGGTFGPELDKQTVNLGRVFVEWRGAVESLPPSGAHDLQGLDPDKVTELGEVLQGSRPGRQSDDEITVYRSTGLAIEDAAAARLVYDKAVEVGLGIDIEI